jgi:hypothetical protein
MQLLAAPQEQIQEHKLLVIGFVSKYAQKTPEEHGSGCFSFFNVFRKQTSQQQLKRDESYKPAESDVKNSITMDAALVRAPGTLDPKIRSELLANANRSAVCCALSEESDDFWRLGAAPSEMAPPMYSAEKSKDVYRPEVLKTIERVLAHIDKDLRALSLDIHDHPEVMFEEKWSPAFLYRMQRLTTCRHAHCVLTEFMEGQGFDVTRHYKDMETAWRAAYTHVSKSDVGITKKVPVLGVNSEMDALPVSSTDWLVINSF